MNYKLNSNRPITCGDSGVFKFDSKPKPKLKNKKISRSKEKRDKKAFFKGLKKKAKVNKNQKEQRYQKYLGSLFNGI